MSSIANASNPIAARPRRRFPAGHGGAFPLAAKPAPSRLQPTHSRPGAAHRTPQQGCAALPFGASAALQQAAAALMATPKSS